MKTTNTKRRLAETALGAAIGAAIAGPAGAIAGGLVGNQAASGIENLGARKRPRKKSKPAAKAGGTRTIGSGATSKSKRTGESG